jgi:hypothetical protein
MPHTPLSTTNTKADALAVVAETISGFAKQGLISDHYGLVGRVRGMVYMLGVVGWITLEESDAFFAEIDVAHAESIIRGIDLNAPCPCCKGNGLHPVQVEGCADEELKDCPVCGGCGDMSTAVEAKIERLAKGSVPHSHFVSQGFAARMIFKAEQIHARIQLN